MTVNSDWEGKITFTDWINTTSKVHYAVVEPGHSYGISLEKLADEIAISWTGRLQRATRLAPPDWEDVPITNDQFRIHGNVTDPMAFFRVFPPLDPGKPPGGNFNLSHWKLTLPDADSSEISAARLMAGFTNSFFYTDADGAAVFLSPVTGGPTPGSVYPRCEFRELLNPTNDHVNWTGYGAHIMNGQCKVTRMPSSKKIIIAQIHSFTGNAYPLMKLQFNNGAVQALVKESPNSSADTLFAFANVGLNNLIAYQIKVVDGLLSMRVNGINQSVNVFQTDPAWTNQTFYFKAGNYCQDNSGPTNEVAVVSYYQLSVTHWSAPNTQAVNINAAVNAGAHSSFTTGRDRDNDSILASTVFPRCPKP